MAEANAPHAAGLPVLILAGDDPDKPSPLALSERVPQRAMIEVGSRPMIDWALEAVRLSPRTGQIAVVGLDLPGFDPGVDVKQIPSAGDLADNLIAGLDWAAHEAGERSPVLILGCDTPLISPQAITWFVDACGDRSLDLYLAVVRQETMEAIYPRNQRHWFRMQEGRFCAGDLAIARPEALLRSRQHLRTMVENRLNNMALMQFLPVSWRVRAALGTLQLWEVRDRMQQQTGLRVTAVELPFAAPALDVETAEDLAAARNEMALRRMLAAA